MVSRLIAGQFPQWASLPVKPVEVSGWDNRTFRLGERMSVRLPSAEGYTPQVAKEQRWLPFLAPLLPLPIPTPLGLGAPAEGYPWPWSVYGWLEGESAVSAPISDLARVAWQMAHFLNVLQSLDAESGPRFGPHSFYRGGPLTNYDAETRHAIGILGAEIDAAAALAVWEAAVSATWHGPPVWFHGDVSAGNVLIDGGQLSAVIDFGCAGVGDPACDTVIAWTLFEGESRQAFVNALAADAATWARGRGWALWKALIVLEEHCASDAVKAAEARRVLGEVLRGEVVSGSG
ncbi:aminoglycoside phosphotransferase family protein [Deinococcus detaillensis]|uniref:aminoglycoside phosphotransferase family protein n=1 Tax=Deinococcus detaillensis TaxID=2592048 RepID=UPI001CDC7055|nr:aminoglycoside phosphotransferase family protein [Deinococcus detaillensis]